MISTVNLLSFSPEPDSKVNTPYRETIFTMNFLVYRTHTHVFTSQDVVTRYAHQSGFHVERRFGWDCHGLPVEYEIDKKLGIKVRLLEPSPLLQYGFHSDSVYRAISTDFN